MSRRRKNNHKKPILLLTFTVVIIGLVAFGIFKSVSLHKNKVNSVQADNSVAKQNPEKTHKDSDIIPGNNIIYSADKYAVPANEVEQMLEAKYEGKDKYVFLTFDDGPSKNTSKILEILKEKGVHATFFVIGANLNEKSNEELLKEEIEDGNAIANHTYSHDYKKLYPHNETNVQYFMDEVNKTNDKMKEILGDSFDTRVLRMPGGYMSRKYYKDPNLPKLNEALAKANIVNLDWDAETGDATGQKLTVEEMVQNAGKHLNVEDHVILLMHDANAKVQTVEALPSIIDFFKEKGYAFKVIKNSPIDKTTITEESNENSK